MTLDPAWLLAALSIRLPRARERATLSLVPWSGELDVPATPTGLDANGLWACLELRRTGSPGSSTGLCPIFLPAHLETPPERALAYLDGWLTVVDEVLDCAGTNVLANLRPNLLFRPQVLDLKRAKTADDFAKALRAEKHLGKLVGEPTAAIRRIDHGTS